MREIAGGIIRRCYLFYGDEKLLIDEARTALRAQLVDDATEAFNYHQFEWEPGRLRQALEMARTLPLFAQRRMVVLMDCPLFGRSTRGDAGDDGASKEKDEGEATALLSYLEQPAESACLVITAPSADPRRRLTKAVAAFGTAIACPELTEQEASTWVQRRVGQLGKKLDPAAAIQLVAMAGTNLYGLAAEVEKLVLFAGEGNRLRLEDVNLLVAGTAQGEIFDLLDALGRRRTGDALVLLGQFLRRGDPGPVLITQIARHVRNLVIARTYLDQGRSPEQAATDRKQHPFYWRKLMDQARGFSGAELVQAMSDLLQGDLDMKTGQAPEQVLQRLVLTLAGRTHPRPVTMELGRRIR